MELLVLLSVLAAGLGLLGVIGWRERRVDVMQTVELRFGNDVTTKAVEAMLAGISSLPGNALVQFHVLAGEGGLRHFLCAPQSALDTLRSQWRGVLPSLRMDEPENLPVVEWSGGVLLRLSGSYPVLRRDAIEESVAATLGALQPLAAGEYLRVTWQLTGGRRPTLPATTSRSAQNTPGVLASLLSSTPLSADHRRLLSAKYAGPVLSGVGVVTVAAAHPKRAAHLASRVVSVARSRGGAYGNVAARRRSAKQIARLLDRPRLGGGNLYCPSELAALINLPIAAPSVAGLVIGVAPVLMPSPRIPSEGFVLGVSTWPGIERRLAQPVAGATSHTLVCGPTGVGKSSLMCSLAVQQALAGLGFVFLDGKGGEMADDLVSRLPKWRHRDVMLLDTSSDAPISGLRMFGRGTDVETTAELVLGILAELHRDSWGPMSAKWMRAALLAVAHDPQGTIADVPLVFSDDRYRRRLVSLMDDVLLKSTFVAYEGMSPAERTHQVAAALNKLDELVGRRIVRSVLAQSDPAIDMHEVLRSGKIVILSVSPARVGPAARLIAALAVFKLHEAAMARTAQPASTLQPFFFFCDEPRVLANLPVPTDSLFEMARSANVGVVLSAQSLSQLPTDLRSAAATNAASWVVFRQSSGDAKLLAPELPGVSTDALQHLNQYEAIMRIALGPGDVTAPVSARTLPPPPPISDPAEVRRVSAERYGVDPAEVDAALAKRHQPTASDDTPVGLLRRQP